MTATVGKALVVVLGLVAGYAVTVLWMTRRWKLDREYDSEYGTMSREYRMKYLAGL